MKRCHKCGKEWVSDKRQPGVKEFCPECTAYLHCCKNCRFHDPRAHNQCLIPNTEWVAERAGCNFCDEFEFKDTGADSGCNEGKQEKARDALSELLGGEVDRAEEGRGAFGKLFGD